MEHTAQDMAELSDCESYEQRHRRVHQLVLEGSICDRVKERMITAIDIDQE
jgi:hypothetical protein